MRTLNFYPYYEPLLAANEKTTTFRLSDVDYMPGETVRLTVGWDENEGRHLHNAVIEQVYRKAIHELASSDFAGESPDCLTPEATALVLSCIYRRVVTVDQNIWVIKFRHL